MLCKSCYPTNANDLLDLAQPAEQRILYDAMDNDTRNDGKRQIVSNLVAAASQTRPVLIVVEDTHWADEGDRTPIRA